MSGGTAKGKKGPAISPMMTTLAAYLAASPRKALPPAVVEKTKHHLLDTLAGGGRRALAREHDPQRQARRYAQLVEQSA